MEVLAIQKRKMKAQIEFNNFNIDNKIKSHFDYKYNNSLS